MHCWNQCTWLLCSTLGGSQRVTPGEQAVPPAPPQDGSRGGWELDGVDLQEELVNRVPMLKSCPHFLRGRLRDCLAVALRQRHRAKLSGGQTRAWKLFCLIPKMLMHTPRNTGSVGRDGTVDPRGERVHVTPQSRYSKHTRRRNQETGSGRPEQSIEGTCFTSAKR